MTLDNAYTLYTSDEARAYYDRWSDGYDSELEANGYATPLRCARALADAALLPTSPMVELGCGTGLSGLALQAAGFEKIDGFDISADMLSKARSKGIYRHLELLDLSQPIELPVGTYHNAAAIGVLNPRQMPVTVLDTVLKLLPTGGCFVFSLSDHVLADGRMTTRISELTQQRFAEVVFEEHGPHLPAIGLLSSVVVLRKL